MHLRTVLLAAIAGSLITGLLATPAGAKTVRCSPLYMKGVSDLIAKNVSCSAAKRIQKRALAHPGCTPTAEQKSNFEGCYSSRRYGRWTCRGLWPGEGYDLRCKSGRRVVHASGGG